jgi:hypothetical protein
MLTESRLVTADLQNLKWTKGILPHLAAQESYLFPYPEGFLG